MIEDILFNLTREDFSVITQREATVISLKYGLNGEEKKTLKEIGKLWDVSPERIRQVINKARKKIIKRRKNNG